MSMMGSRSHRDALRSLVGLLNDPVEIRAHVETLHLAAEKHDRVFRGVSMELLHDIRWGNEYLKFQTGAPEVLLMLSLSVNEVCDRASIRTARHRVPL